jgi:hypothetical protein
MVRTHRARLGALILPVVSLLAWPGAAAGECRQTEILSEARRARWLIGDELHGQNVLNADRSEVRAARAELGGETPDVQVFGATYGSYQWLRGPFPVCNGPEDHRIALHRTRGVVSLGATHTESGLHFRLSVAGARDWLNDDDDEDRPAIASSSQALYVARAGHERWGNVLFGYVTGDHAEAAPPGKGRLFDVGERRGRAPGLYYGVGIPALRMNVVALSQRGTPELVSMMTHDLRVPGLPVWGGLGPTYIREERQAVGLVRVGVDVQARHEPPRRIDHDDEGVYVGPSVVSESSHDGPMVEASAESRGARLRHARLRYAFGGHWRSRIEGKHAEHLRYGAYLESTAFRSLAFSESVDPSSHRKRGTAWGGGAGFFGFVGGRHASLGADILLAINRPEILAVAPSAAGSFEVQTGIYVRLED